MSSSARGSNGFSFSSSSSPFSKRKTRVRRMSAVTSKSSRRSGQVGRRTRRRCSIEVAEKLESLRNLIPQGRGGGGDEEVGKPATDRLFQETADYILRLRAQVVVLQRLIQRYGSDSSQTDAVSDAVL